MKGIWSEERNIFGWMGMIAAEWVMNKGNRDGGEEETDRQRMIKVLWWGGGYFIFFMVVILKMEMEGWRRISI